MFLALFSSFSEALQVIHHPRERAEDMAAHELMKRFPKLLRSSASQSFS